MATGGSAAEEARHRLVDTKDHKVLTLDQMPIDILKCIMDYTDPIWIINLRRTCSAFRSPLLTKPMDHKTRRMTFRSASVLQAWLTRPFAPGEPYCARLMDHECPYYTSQFCGLAFCVAFCDTCLAFQAISHFNSGYAAVVHANNMIEMVPFTENTTCSTCQGYSRGRYAKPDYDILHTYNLARLPSKKDGKSILHTSSNLDPALH
jgi:hypothetical protein